MKALLYKNPVVSALIINTAVLVLTLYSMFYEEVWFMVWIPLVGLLNRRIIDNGKNINKKKKTIILFSFIFMVVSFLAYNVYLYKIRNAGL